MSEIFLSYSRSDLAKAEELEKALKKLHFRVWRDEHSIAAGDHFADIIEKGIRRATCTVLLLSPKSATSPWVTYEYGFATGLGKRVFAVVVGDTPIPQPLQRYQHVRYAGATGMAAQIDAALSGPLRAPSENRATPLLVAKFREDNGQLQPLGKHPFPAYRIEMWVEGAPKTTESVSFEILDAGFRDPVWTVRRRKTTPRQFLTNDMSSYGNVDIWACGNVSHGQPWTLTTTLHHALEAYYRDHAPNPETKRALKQIERE